MPPPKKKHDASNLGKPPMWIFCCQETTTKSVTTKRSQVSKERAMPKASKFTLATKQLGFSQPRLNTVGLGCWAKGLPLTNLSCLIRWLVILIRQIGTFPKGVPWSVNESNEGELGGDFNPSERNISWIGSFPPSRWWKMVKITNIYLKPPPNNKNHGKVDPRGACTMYLRMFMFFFRLSLCPEKKIDFFERHLRKKKSGKLSGVSLSCLPITNHLLSLPYSLRYPMMWKTRAMEDHMGALPFPFAEHRFANVFFTGFFWTSWLRGSGFCWSTTQNRRKRVKKWPIFCQGLAAQKRCKTMNFPPFSLKEKSNLAILLVTFLGCG